MMAVRSANRRNVSEHDTWWGVAATNASVLRKRNSSTGRNRKYRALFHPSSRRTSAWCQRTIFSVFRRKRSDRTRAATAMGFG